VVTANKDLLTDQGRALRRQAERTGAPLLAAAACGGGAPMLERTADLGGRHDLVRLRGVVNGTSNWILDRLYAGDDLDESIAQAQAAGYAESDPTADIAGHDAARKLCLLAHEAWGLALAPEEVETSGLVTITADALADARRLGRRPRLVAEARRQGHGVTASVSVRYLPPADLLSGVAGVQNRLVLESTAGERWIVDGLGAGRWPTAQAVLADLLALAARRHEQPAIRERPRAVRHRATG